jgi:hypothetical protein
MLHLIVYSLIFQRTSTCFRWNSSNRSIKGCSVSIYTIHISTLQFSVALSACVRQHKPNYEIVYNVTKHQTRIFRHHILLARKDSPASLLHNLRESTILHAKVRYPDTKCVSETSCMYLLTSRIQS